MIRDKKITRISFILIMVSSFLLIVSSCRQDREGSVEAKNRTVAPAQEDNSIKSRSITVYYFHTTHRCYSCTKIEELTKESLDDRFSKEMAKGVVVFKAVNVDKEENKHFIQDFQLFTKSIVLVEKVKGKQQKWKRLDKTWSYLRDREKFHQYISDEVNLFIKGNS